MSRSGIWTWAPLATPLLPGSQVWALDATRAAFDRADRMGA